MLKRREFIKSSAVLGGLSVLPGSFSSLAYSDQMEFLKKVQDGQSIIGSYGPWAAGLVNDPPELSFRNDGFTDLESWRLSACEKAEEHEHIMAKSLFCAGTTWPGVFLAEDQILFEACVQASSFYDACCRIQWLH